MCVLFRSAIEGEMLREGFVIWSGGEAENMREGEKESGEGMKGGREEEGEVRGREKMS